MPTIHWTEADVEFASQLKIDLDIKEYVPRREVVYAPPQPSRFLLLTFFVGCAAICGVACVGFYFFD